MTVFNSEYIKNDYFRDTRYSLIKSPVEPFDPDRISILRSQEILTPDEIIYIARTCARSGSESSEKGDAISAKGHACISSLKGVVKSGILLGKLRRLHRRSSYHAYENSVLAAAEEASAVPEILDDPESAAILYEEVLDHLIPEKILSGLMEREASISRAQDLFLTEAYSLSLILQLPYQHMSEKLQEEDALERKEEIIEEARQLMASDQYVLARALAVRLLLSADDTDKSIQLRYVFSGALHSKYKSIILDRDLYNTVFQAALSSGMDAQIVYYLTKYERYRSGSDKYDHKAPLSEQSQNYQDAYQSMAMKLFMKLENYEPRKGSMVTFMANDFTGTAAVANYADANISRATINILGQIEKAYGIARDQSTQKWIREGLPESTAKQQAESLKLTNDQLAAIITNFSSRPVSPESIRNALEARNHLAISYDASDKALAGIEKAVPLFGRGGEDPEMTAINRATLDSLWKKMDSIPDREARELAYIYIESFIASERGDRKKPMTRKELTAEFQNRHEGEGLKPGYVSLKIDIAFNYIGFTSSGYSTANSGLRIASTNSFSADDFDLDFSSLDDMIEKDPGFLDYLFPKGNTSVC